MCHYDGDGDGHGENADKSEGICEENWAIDRVRIDCVMVFTLNEHRSLSLQSVNDSIWLLYMNNVRTCVNGN